MGIPRLVVAGLSGESGKTLVTLALLLEAKRRNIPAQAFKKGPDYVDAAWLRWASSRPARNLDTHLMGFDEVRRSFAQNGLRDGVNLVEGNRGLYDGLDARGTHSTAELAKAIQSPVVLVIDATKVTRTVAAMALGCQKLDPDVQIAGVILNQVAGARHERVIRDSIEAACGIPVFGAVPRAPEGALLSTRHLGLVTPQEFDGQEELARNLLERVARYLDFDRLLQLAHSAPPLPPALGNDVRGNRGGAGTHACCAENRLGASADREQRGRDEQGTFPCNGGLEPSLETANRVGYLHDSAFSFYYPENLEALETAGARLIAISALTSGELPDDLDALYIGGGFPETHARTLSGNASFLASVRRAAREGLPIYAECGGLMLLARALSWQGEKFPMAGVLPFEVEMCAKPQGHGYSELLVDRTNPFFPVGTTLRGHEFHYSRIVPGADAPPTAAAIVRGAGSLNRRDGVIVDNVWAAYTHLHALGTPEWARGMLHAARAFQGQRSLATV